MENLNTIMLQKMTEGIDSFLDNCNQEIEFTQKYGRVSWFYGGSFRFNYTNGSSDLDVFIYVPKGISSFLKFIRQYDFDVVNDTYYKGTCSISTKNKFANVHTNVICNSLIYNEMKKQHDRIERFLNENPILRNVARNLKIYNKVKGVDVYRLFLRLMEEGCPSAYLKTGN